MTFSTAAGPRQIRRGHAGFRTQAPSLKRNAFWNPLATLPLPVTWVATVGSLCSRSSAVPVFSWPWRLLS